MSEAEKPDLTSLTVQLLSAYVSNNTVQSSELAGLIQSTRAALSDEQPAAEPTAPEHVAATTARKSLASRDHIISMIDGKPYKTLKRHLSTHGLTPAEYRERYKLPQDYPMVATGYSEQRREVAQRLGLGRRPAVAPAGDESASPAALAQTAADAQPESASAAPDAAAPVSEPTVKAGKKTNGNGKAKPAKAAAALASVPKVERPRRGKAASAVAESSRPPELEETPVSDAAPISPAETSSSAPIADEVPAVAEAAAKPATKARAGRKAGSPTPAAAESAKPVRARRAKGSETPPAATPKAGRGRKASAQPASEG